MPIVDTPSSAGLRITDVAAPITRHVNGDQMNENSLHRQLAASTTIASASNRTTLPASEIDVASTAGFPDAGSFTIGALASVITYTSKTSTSFLGCTGGDGTMETGMAITGGTIIPSTTVGSGSNTVTLPAATIHVASTTGFPSFGAIWIGELATLVNYTGLSSTTFTGCTGGAGTMETGMAITVACPNLTLFRLACLLCVVANSVNLIDVQTFTASGTWTAPSWITAGSVVEAEVLGDGGGGGGGQFSASSSTVSGGGGGGPGGRTKRRATWAGWGSPATLDVGVGQGGAGGAGGHLGALTGVDGTVGTGSYLGTVQAGGGGGGSKGSVGTGGAAGGGDLAGGAGGAGGSGGFGVSGPDGLGGPSGGGGGGGCNNTTPFAGGAGGPVAGQNAAVYPGGGAGIAGATGGASVPIGPGLGGGGGGGQNSGGAPGGAGGGGGGKGGGGGGGGACQGIGVAGGVGGAGAAGYVIVTVYR